MGHTTSAAEVSIVTVHHVTILKAQHFATYIHVTKWRIKMGRPPIGKIAMTAAERVRRYRLRHGTDKPVTKPATKRSADKTTGLLKARIRDLEAESMI